VLFQQTIALAQNALIARGQRVRGGYQGHDDLVHEGAPASGIARDHRQIEGTEHDRAHLSAQIALPTDRRAIHLDLVRASRSDLDLDEHPAALRVELSAHVAGLGATPDQRLARGRTGALQRVEEVHALEQVGLALAVGAHRNE